jgi:hypothetical protein
VYGELMSILIVKDIDFIIVDEIDFIHREKLIPHMIEWMTG